MIDGGHDLRIMRQALLLELSRSVVYYRPQPTSAADLALMRQAGQEGDNRTTLRAELQISPQLWPSLTGRRNLL
jgi:hypothetical protein